VLYRQLQTLLEMRFFSYDFTAEDQAAQQFREINKQLQEVDLLILDEVCVNETVLKKSAQSWLGNLLRQRAAENKNCIIITNHQLSELEKALGRYCFESIKEYETYKVRFQGPSRREKVQEDTQQTQQDGVEDPQYLEHFGRARESRRFYQTIQHRPPRQIMRVNRERVRPIELV